MAITQATRDAAKRLYQDDGMTKAAIARTMDVTPQTIYGWAKKYEWDGPSADREDPWGDSETTDLADTSDDVDVPDVSATTHAPPASNTELEAQVIALTAERDDLADENQKLKPTIDIHEWLEDRVAWLTTNTPEGDRYWINRAELEWSTMTRERVRASLPPFNIKDEPEMFQQTIDDLKTKARTRAAAETTEPASRKIKLAIYRGGKDVHDSEGGHLTIEQIPLEGQINNTAGSLADGIIRYTRKGFKLTDPFLCPRAGCFRPAGIDEFQRWQYKGYCSDKHYNEVEVDQDIDLAGVILKDHGVLSGTG